MNFDITTKLTLALDIIERYYVLDHDVSYLLQDIRNQFVLLLHVQPFVSYLLTISSRKLKSETCQNAVKSLMVTSNASITPVRAYQASILTVAVPLFGAKNAPVCRILY